METVGHPGRGESNLYSFLNGQRAWGFVQKVAVSNGVIPP
nr:MAG TPA: hypothetical protein [Caudoviricetes sp.]